MFAGFRAAAWIESHTEKALPTNILACAYAYDNIWNLIQDNPNITVKDIQDFIRREGSRLAEASGDHAERYFQRKVDEWIGR